MSRQLRMHLAVAIAITAAALGMTSVARADVEIARGVSRDIPVYAAPNGAIRAMLDRASSNSGEPRGFLVLDERWIRSERWLQVRLGTRPNTASGWVLASDMALEFSGTSVTISISRRLLTVRRGSAVALRTRVVVGKSSTPTPTGTFAVWDETPLQNSVFSPWVVSLTSHSTVLKTFNGGEARVAIHGMNGSLAVPTGTAVSNGCIRVRPEVMGRIALLVVTGTPVTITA